LAEAPLPLEPGPAHVLVVEDEPKLAAVLADPELKDRYATFGYTPYAPTPEQFAAFMAAESAKYADVVRKSKASLD